MDDRVEELLDKLAIQQVMAAYTRAVDRVDVELMKGAYWEDAIDDHGVFTGSGHDFCDWVCARLPRWRSTTHLLGQMYFASLGGGRAVTETRFNAWSSPHGGGEGTIVGGRYLDVFEKRGQEWRVLNRHCIYDWSGTRSFDGTQSRGVEGQGSRDDRSYGFFAEHGR